MLQKKYQSQQTAIASYDYTDIASGTGYSIFNGGNLDNNTTSGAYVLSNTTFYSNFTSSAGSTTNASFVPVVDEDFDITFNISRIMNGEAILNIPGGIYGNAAGDFEMVIYPTISKVSGADTIFLVSGSCTKFAESVTITQTKSKMFAIPLLIPETHFKKGDILRLNVLVKGLNVGGGTSGMFGVGHDPKNRNDEEWIVNMHQVVIDTIDTNMHLHIPFKIDL